MNRCACLVFALALIAVPVLATIPVPELCILDNAPGSDGAVVFTNPAGSGSPMTEGRLAGGVPVDATLTLTVINSVGDPIANYPASDIYLVSSGISLVTCGLARPGSATDTNGQTTWTAALAAGSNSLGEDAQAIIGGEPVPNTAAVSFVGADISGDLAVNLSDITVFTQALGAFNAAADFNNDQVVNLSDITLMAQAIGAVCP